MAACLLFETIYCELVENSNLGKRKCKTSTALKKFFSSFIFLKEKSHFITVAVITLY